MGVGGVLVQVGVCRYVWVEVEFWCRWEDDHMTMT